MANASFVNLRCGTGPSTVFHVMSNSRPLQPDRGLLSKRQLAELDRLPVHPGDLPAWSDEIAPSAASACRQCGSFRLNVTAPSAGISLILDVTDSTTIQALCTFSATMDALAYEQDDVVVLIDDLPTQAPAGAGLTPAPHISPS